MHDDGAGSASVALIHLPEERNMRNEDEMFEVTSKYCRYWIFSPRHHGCATKNNNNSVLKGQRRMFQKFAENS